MARGIEELAEMQVTGPVQGGDMVMKPDQAPTGAAALLNKMSRQNTPGIFKLPMPDKQMPGFMQVAAEGVEQQTAKGDSINQMAGELMRQGIDIRGMGMDEIIQIYEQTFGSPGDVDEFGVSKVDPSDWRTILKMIQAGMSPEQIDAEIAAAKFPGNFTEEKQNVVELPRNLKTGPDNPETELAYITDDEKALLALMNPGTPHVGPENVPTYDAGDYEAGYDPWTDSAISGTSYSTPDVQATQQQQQDFAEYVAQVGTGKDRGISAYERSGQADQAEIDKVRAGEKIVEDRTAQEYRDKMGMTAATADPYGLGERVSWGTETGDPTATDYTKNLDFLNKQIEVLDKKEKLDREDRKRLKELEERRFNVQGGKTGQGESRLDEDFYDEDGEEKDKEGKTSYTEILKILAPELAMIGKLGKGPTIRELDATGKKSDIMKLLDEYEKYSGGPLESRNKMIENLTKGKGQYRREDDSLTKEGLLKALRSMDMGPDSASALESLKKHDPEAYYNIGGMATTTGALEDLSKQTTIKASDQSGGKLTDDQKSFNQKIFEARETVQRGKEGRDRHPGTGRPIEEQITEEEEVATTTTDPRAGQYNVGGTMPYTEDIRTAGIEMDVPLGRRFQIDKEGKYRGTTGMDLSEAMKYATLGGYSQLEPFQEYLARRRKHLGEDEPRYFDEEGNVIFSETT